MRVICVALLRTACNKATEMKTLAHHLSSSPLLASSLRKELPRSCTRLARPLVCTWQPSRNMAVKAKKKPLSSLELKIKADIVEKTKHEISKTKNPTAAICITNLEKEGVTPEEAMNIWKLAEANKIDSNEVLDKLHMSMSPLVYTLYDSMLQQVYTKKFSLMVLSQLLSCLIQLKSEKAFILLEEMMRVELRPNTKQFGLMSEIYAEKQKWDECFQFLDFMIANQVKPDSFTFSCMLRHFARNAPVVQVEKLKERMVKEAVHVSKHVYWHMQETYARHGMRDKVVEMYESARLEKRQYGKWGQPDKAAEVLDVMKDDLHTTGLTPGVATYNALFEAFCENKAYDRVYNLLDVIKKDKSKYNEDTWNLILESALKNGEDQIIIGISTRMKKVHGRPSKEVEKKVLARMKSKEIDLNAEVNKQFWMIWPDFKMT